MTRRKHPPNPLPCGCWAARVWEPHCEGGRTASRRIYVRFCPLHWAARELLEALKGVLEVDRGTSGRLILELADEEIIRAAIAKATTRSTPMSPEDFLESKRSMG